MIKFINMDFDGSQWWVEYIENGEIKKNYYQNESQAVQFYNSIIN